MREGAWHQFGDRSQTLALEQLQAGAGVGVVISPRDLALHNAIERSQQYHELDAHVLIDLQFYDPSFANGKIKTYPISPFRTSITSLNRFNDQELQEMHVSLKEISEQLEVDGIIAPAAVYEAGRQDITRLNKQLFGVAKRVGKELSIPTYATVALGLSVTNSDATIGPVLSEATGFDCDGWYFVYEFSPERIPSGRDAILRYCRTCLKLALTGMPVLSAFTGPLCLLSFGAGARAVGIGHSQNLWRFSRDRWEPASGTGGGADAPARFFSDSLWGTVVYPDEISQLGATLQKQVYTPSAFSPNGFTRPPFDFTRWDANKHLINSLCNAVSNTLINASTRDRANAAINKLESAVILHNRVTSMGLVLKDNTAAYQQNWIDAMRLLLQDNADDYEYLEMLTG